jgi:hypothetical protein
MKWEKQSKRFMMIFAFEQGSPLAAICQVHIMQMHCMTEDLP